ncbi:hypothetical protein HY643_04150 [Candidatus Woesearchaeota archaeon]|nr:hypothetical protein [Candidatus Woesearchaeota archaeon]
MKSEHKLLILIFILALTLRIFFVFQTPNFSSDKSYYHIRHTEHIAHNFVPIIYDSLSYGGRTIVDSHVFHYFLAIFNLASSTLAFKIVPALLLSSLIFIIYGIAVRISNNKKVALVSALMAGFLPIYINQTINQVSAYALTLPLLFYAIYCFLDLKKNLNAFIVLSFILPILHPISFIFSLALILYAVLLSLDNIASEKLEKEAIIFYVFITLLINAIIYKKALLAMGLTAVWQAIPKELLANYFKEVSVVELIYTTGVIPLIAGGLGFVFGVFKEKNKNTYLLGSLSLVTLFLLTLKLIDFKIGVMFFGLVLCIISAISLEKLFNYMEMTKISKYRKTLSYLFILLIALTLIIPSFYSAKGIIGQGPSQEKINALLWIKENTPQISVVLADVGEGNLISAIAERKNVADTSFLLAPNRYPDVSEIFTTQSLAKAINLLHRNGVDYIYLSQETKKSYNLNKPAYLEDTNCFKRIYETETDKIYEVVC